MTPPTPSPRPSPAGFSDECQSQPAPAIPGPAPGPAAGGPARHRGPGPAALSCSGAPRMPPGALLAPGRRSRPALAAGPTAQPAGPAGHHRRPRRSGGPAGVPPLAERLRPGARWLRHPRPSGPISSPWRRRAGRGAAGPAVDSCPGLRWGGHPPGLRRRLVRPAAGRAHLGPSAGPGGAAPGLPG